MILGIPNFKLILLLLLFLSCNKKSFDNCSDNDVLKAYYNTLSLLKIEENLGVEADTINLDNYKLQIDYIDKKEFDGALIKSCNIRLFSSSRGNINRYNEYEDDRITRVSKDSLYLGKKGKYLVDQFDSSGLFCGHNLCDIDYFMEARMESYFLVKVVLKKTPLSIVYTDDLIPYKQLPYQTIFCESKNILFSTDVMLLNPEETSKIVFYRLKDKEIKEIAQIKSKNKVLSPFLFEEEIYFIYSKEDAYYYAKLNIPF